MKNNYKFKILSAFIALLFLCIACNQALNHLDIHLDLYSDYGTMTPEKQRIIFSQPQQAKAYYKAIIPIPGVTAT